MSYPDYFGYKALPVSSTPLDNKLPVTNSPPNIHEDFYDISEVNDWVNKNVKYEKDAADEWKSPWSTIADMKGDCEDYALLKRALLISKGIVQPKDIFLVIGAEVVPGFKAQPVGNHHALLAIRYGDMWLVLDNIAKKATQDEAFKGIFIPIFSFNSDHIDWEGCRKYLHGK